jgi:hypothetical protein
MPGIFYLNQFRVRNIVSESFAELQELKFIVHAPENQSSCLDFMKQMSDFRRQIGI